MIRQSTAALVLAALCGSTALYGQRSRHDEPAPPKKTKNRDKAKAARKQNYKRKQRK